MLFLTPNQQCRSIEGNILYILHHTTTVLWPFFRDNPGEPVPEENFWTLWCKGRLTEANTPTIRLGAIPSRLTSAHLHHPHILFYRPDALPAAQPTVSKHCIFYSIIQLFALQLGWVPQFKKMTRKRKQPNSDKLVTNDYHWLTKKYNYS